MNHGLRMRVGTLLAISCIPALAGQKVLPVLNAPLRAISLQPGSGTRTIPLGQHFGTEAIDDQVVRFTTNYTLDAQPMVLDLAMFSSRTPATRTNFLKYVTDGDYLNSIFHRSVPGFVIQGGGFRLDENGSLSAVPTDTPVVNEFGISNTYGTVSMAKLGSSPDSATSQWFISLGHNSANLDLQNGGFTVFATVTKSTLGNAEIFGNPSYFPVLNYSSYYNNPALSQLPIRPNSGGPIRFTSAGLAPLPAADAGESTTLTYSIPYNSNPGMADVTIQGDQLAITLLATGQASGSFVVRATDSVGNMVDEVVSLATARTYAEWKTQTFPASEASDPLISGPEADPDGDGYTNLELFLHGLPRSGTIANPVRFSSSLAGGAQRPMFTFPVRNDITGVTWTLEKSASLAGPGSWVTVASSEVSRTTAGAVDTVTVQPQESYTGSNAFYRLRFALAAP